MLFLKEKKIGMLKPLSKFIVIMLCTLGIFKTAFAQETLWQYEVGDESISVQHIKVGSLYQNAEKVQARIVWLPSEYGVLPEEKVIAQTLANRGIESWFVDFYETMFLSPASSSVDQINPLWTAKLIELAMQDDLPVWIIAPNKAAQTAIRGLQTVLQNPQNSLGLIFINPNLYLETPAPGLLAEYWSETANVNLPISIIQAELSPWKWRLQTLNQQLVKGGSDVSIQVLEEVRDRFYFRPDATPIENQQAAKLAQTLLAAMRLQLPHLSKLRQIEPLDKSESKPALAKQSAVLSKYKGLQNLGLNLVDQAGHLHKLQDYQGQVVLVNFWASWCPPCVHEMPSMNRLKNGLIDEPFEILAVNLGESEFQIAQFLKSYPMNFPILRDQKSQAVKDWQVFAYPSSYLIDKQGQIRFALFGATDWASGENIQVIKMLLNESN